MKTHQQWLDYQALELIPPDEEKSTRLWHRWLAALSSWWSYGINRLEALIILDAQPRIWQKTDRHGNTWWSIYDPMTRRFYQFSSEHDVRVWLDEHFIQRSDW
ncbi:MAG: hypothetical protein ACFE0I_24275 [Elainellaceae cyanobacterium]